MRREKKSPGGVDCPADRLRRKTAYLFFCVLVYSLITTVAHAQTYYVSLSGEDSNPGTAAAPFRTINRALSVIGTIPGAGAGQTVEVAGGTYNESIMFNLPSGSSWDQPFTLRARPGDVVIMQAYDPVNIFIADGIDYYSIIEGFVFDAANTWQGQVIIGNCCDPQPRSVRFQKNEFINNRFGAFFISGDQNEIINNKIHDGFQEFTGCGQVHCFGYAFYVGGSKNLFAGNEIYDVASWVFHIYSSLPEEQVTGAEITNRRPSDNVVRNNLIHDFGYGDSRADAILLSSGSRNVAYENIIYNGSSGVSAWDCDGCGIFYNKISSMNRCLEVSDSSDVTVDGNVLSDCGSAYISVINAPDAIISNTSCDHAAQNCQ